MTRPEAWGFVLLAAAVGAVGSGVGCISSDRPSGLGQEDGDASPPDLTTPDGDADDDSGAVDGDPGDADAAGPDTTPLLGGGAPCSDDEACASGRCLLGSAGRACAFSCDGATCPDGLECRLTARGRVCVDRFAALCKPCLDHPECNLGSDAGLDGERNANRCLAGDDPNDGRYCAVACGGTFGDCPAGIACVDGQCRVAEACACSALAVLGDASTTCAAESPSGERCTGTRRCEVAGEEPTACDAATPLPEACNGRDDDCDGETDEGALTPSCGEFACRGEAGCAERCETRADCAPGLACDVADRDGDQRTDECIATGEDGTACVLDGECDSDYCDNGFCCERGDRVAPCCAVDDDCAMLDGPPRCADESACLGTRPVGRCQDAVCVAVDEPAPAGCLGHICLAASCRDDGDFDNAHRCDLGGACLDTADDDCDDGLACTRDDCDEGTGCAHTAITGATDTACWDGDVRLRGVGRCEDGHIACDAGVESGCADQVGPFAETCNGEDDDCDGLPDDDTEVECFPFLCGGPSGCLTACNGDGQCAAGNFCKDGVCVGTGDDGAACPDDAACKSGHCVGGVCCEAGLCCRSDSECRSLDATSCDVAASTGCAGTRVVGFCGAGSACETEVFADATACTGVVCAPGDCSGAIRVQEGICEGAQCQRAPEEDCIPYACSAGQCFPACQVDAHCSGGATCSNGVCRGLPNGKPCEDDDACASGHCGNGFCCASGQCCGGAHAACSALDGARSCTDAAQCFGTRVAGRCGADFRCAAETIEDPAACAGQSCGDATCVNLVGGSFTLEGVQRDVCDTTGTCVAQTHDCRDAGDAECVSNSGLAGLACADCAPNRTTCLVYADGCYCE